MSRLNLNNVLIESDDPEALAVFYSRVFGDPMWRSGGWTVWEAGDGFLTVGPRTELTEPGDKPGRVVIGFVTEDVPGEFSRLTKAGAEAVRDPFHPADDPEGWLAFLVDPDGNRSQIMWPTQGPGRVDTASA
jgi:predicted enzyme related to lactoylglutathione lyase